MAWYHEAVFYHVYPLGLLQAEKQNDYSKQHHRLSELSAWIEATKILGITAWYIGPVFESIGHGYETTDYRKIDSRLGTNEEFRELIQLCHQSGIKVILDAVFNHTGRDFFAFRDLLQNREASPFRYWYKDVNFYGNNSYQDGFSYATWGGYDLLPKLDLTNPDVRNYHLETVRFWIEHFDIDGLRMDAADQLDFGFLHELRTFTESKKPDFWLMGEVIHGDYSRWIHDSMLHSVTDYALYKALYSAHNDKNYFEIAHTIQRHINLGIDVRNLYHFADNHDVDRIISKLNRPDTWLPLHILLFTLPGIPSIYYGSEYGIRGKKVHGDDSPLRPSLQLAQLQTETSALYYFERIHLLAELRKAEKALAYGSYRQLYLTTEQYAFSRNHIIVAVSCGSSESHFSVPCPNGTYHGVLTNRTFYAADGSLSFDLECNTGEIFVPEQADPVDYPELQIERKTIVREAKTALSNSSAAIPNKPYEQMTVPELQACILEKLAKNGPVTDRMRREVSENIYPNSLLNWVKSFR